MLLLEFRIVGKRDPPTFRSKVAAMYIEALLCLRLRRITRNKIFRYLSTAYRFLGWMSRVSSKSKPSEDNAARQHLSV